MPTLNGAATAVFAVRLSEPSKNIVLLTWQTEDGTGKAGIDYKAANGSLTFQPGQIEKNIQVDVYGRDPADTREDRGFKIRINPPVGAVVENALAECVISVVELDGTILTSVYLPAGPRGLRGLPGLSTYELAVLNGYEGTLAEWLSTVNGRNVELKNDGNSIVWRVVGDVEWQTLVAVADISGKDGDPGKNIQLQRSATHIQWRVVGDAAWTNLIALADLRGLPGETGKSLVNRDNWLSGTTYKPGDYVAATSSTATDSKSLYFLLGTADYNSTTEPKNDATHWLELLPPPGPKGTDGKQIELHASTTAIEMRYQGDSAWIELVQLADLKGSSGDDGKNIQLQKTATYVQWRVVGSTTWTNLIALSDLKGGPGDNGKNIELQKSATHIQWRVAGDTAWTNLVALADLGASFATADEAKAFTVTDKAIAPDTLKAALDSLNLGSASMVAATDLNNVRINQPFAWANTSTNTPVASSYGRGFTFASDVSNITQLGIINGTGKAWVRYRNGGTWGAWSLLVPLATTAQAKAATSADLAATPAGVREFMEQYGFTSSYTDVVASLNAVTSTTDRTVVFNFSNTTTNTPVANSYGRGMMWASGGNYSTQLAIINGTGDMYVRFNNGGTWGAWIGPMLKASDAVGFTDKENTWTSRQIITGSNELMKFLPTATGQAAFIRAYKGDGAIHWFLGKGAAASDSISWQNYVGNGSLTLALTGEVVIAAASASYNFKTNGTATATSWSNTSDKRIKKSYTALKFDECAQIINALTGYRGKKKMNPFNDDVTDYVDDSYLFAQDVKKVLPTAVTYAGEGFDNNGVAISDVMGVNYNALTPYIIETLKGLMNEVADLKSKVAALSSGEGK